MKKLKSRTGILIVAVLLVVALLAAVMVSSNAAAKRDLDEAIASKREADATPAPEVTPVPTPTLRPGPQKEEVLAMRETVLDGMAEEDINELCSLVKQTNRSIEWNVIYRNPFERLSDPDDPVWNYFDQTGEILIGWFYDGKISKPDVMKEENLTEEEFLEKYGEPIVTSNEYDAEGYAQLFEKCRDTVANEALRSDLQYVIDEVRLAQETHDVTHVEKLYHVLHDMDYFLLNYRLDTEGQYIRDKSTISRYYGVLAVYGEEKE